MEHVDVAEVPLDVGRKQGVRRTAGLEWMIDAGGPEQARDVADVGTGPRPLHDRRGPMEDSATQRAEPVSEHLGAASRRPRAADQCWLTRTHTVLSQPCSARTEPSMRQRPARRPTHSGWRAT